MSASSPAPRPTGASIARIPRPAPPSRWSYRFAAAVTVALGSLLARSPAYADVPQPHSDPPPGTEGVTTILNWGFWLVSALGVGGILLVAAMMTVKHRRGEGGESMGSLGFVLGALILATASGPIAEVLI
jgi:hypothetical protein